jgi:hypothetical protein
MKYIKWHLIDAVTGKYTNDCMTENGLTHPSIAGLDCKLSYNELYYGTCSDTVTTVDLPAVIMTSADLATELASIFAELKKDKLSNVAKIAINKRAELLDSSYHSSEITAGVVKYQQALLAQAAATDADADTAAPQLAMEATTRGCTTKVLANLVIAKYTAFMNLEASIAGYCGKLNDQIKEVVWVDADLFDNFNKLSAIDINSGWPV